VICSNGDGYKEIDITSGRYIVLIFRRTKSANAITPHADKQYKFSLALESGQPVHTNCTGEIGADVIIKEGKKARATGCERLIIITPKKFKKGDIQKIPENCAVVAGKDLINFIGLYADVVARISKKPDDDLVSRFNRETNIF